MTGPLLDVKNLNAWYGESHVLHGLDFEVRKGEVVTLIGRNGAGKTTALRSLMGLVRRSGQLAFDGHDVAKLPSHKIARLGLAICPEDRGIFRALTVTENLNLPPVVAPGGMTIEAIYDVFPNLRERSRNSGGNLSGGEQQMLALARILRTGAQCLLLDEPTEGLAPVIVSQIASVMQTIRDRGFTVLLVEQNFRFAARVSDRFYVIETGRIVDEMLAADVQQHESKIKGYLGV
ncbi:ABC transporter ATP-binding protein [Rhizobium sp. Root149]|uniref:ABC transporter ATP-binding protein n=1 Tax=Rhizobium sp. Root149 TaxID=1736473 RepID=UPI000714186A|nr:ABC transporter ATP-binding protein [Rhizobium sp. Root149]KQZ46735.1 ABC transporter ATP-binding protein [Rhizobium sp. Root149]